VVYMGMGEPLANYPAVIKSLRILNHPKGKNIGIRHITVSTCGLAPEIRKLASEDVRPRLAVSLNAPTDAVRTKLMPINIKYPIAELLKAVRFYQDRTHQRVTFEYVLIKGLNDSAGHAKMLVKLLKGLVCNVNLIEHNPFAKCKYSGSGSARIREFAAVLGEAGIETTTRFRMGRNIKAACGQLGADWLDGKTK
jgi:23S rRNA (adenine2503-C2)-methyltransferase